MKVKCDDGVTREFSICRPTDQFAREATDSTCAGCGYNFGVHDTRWLKPHWKAHVCLNDSGKPREGYGP